jgi:hypothetical protein
MRLPQAHMPSAAWQQSSIAVASAASQRSRLHDVMQHLPHLTGSLPQSALADAQSPAPSSLCQLTSIWQLNLRPSPFCHRLVHYLCHWQLLPCYPAHLLLPYLAGVSLASALAESLPLPVDDNLTVPVVALLAGSALLPMLQHA